MTKQPFDSSPPRRGDIVRPKTGGDKAIVMERVVQYRTDHDHVRIKVVPLRKTARWHASSLFFDADRFVVVKRAKAKK